ncbi:MAG: hypothetical protein Q7S32_04230 [bacterium]|nr:hypothetical protein [bacterium]
MDEMKNDEVIVTVRDLLAECLKDEERAIFIGENQPETRDFKIRCSEYGCEGISNPSTVYRSRREHNRVLERFLASERKVARHFHHYIGHLDGTVLLLGACQECGKVLTACVEYVDKSLGY